MSDTDVVKGAIKLQGLLEELCVESAADLVRQLPNLLSIEIPATISNVVVGVQQPGDDKRNNLWVRLDNSGDFVGLYVYADGQWRQVTPAPDQLFKFAHVGADSRNPPAGFTTATEVSFLSTEQKNHLKSFWLLDPTQTFYTIYEAFYTGF